MREASDACRDSGAGLPVAQFGDLSLQHRGLDDFEHGITVNGRIHGCQQSYTPSVTVRAQREGGRAEQLANHPRPIRTRKPRSVVPNTVTNLRKLSY